MNFKFSTNLQAAWLLKRMLQSVIMFDNRKRRSDEDILKCLEIVKEDMHIDAYAVIKSIYESKYGKVTSDRTLYAFINGYGNVMVQDYTTHHLFDDNFLIRQVNLGQYRKIMSFD
jgi:hypothetical protein